MNIVSGASDGTGRDINLAGSIKMLTFLTATQRPEITHKPRIAGAVSAGHRETGRTVMRIAAAGLVVFSALGMAGCAKHQALQSTLAPANAARVQAVPGSKKDFTYNVGDRVLFETDSTTLTQHAREILTAQARWLKQYPAYSITISGHADERGTREYNLGLGAQRAAAVKRFLASQGIDPRRINTISYGKERPVEVCNNITCWSKNRRAVTVLNRVRNG